MVLQPERIFSKKPQWWTGYGVYHKNYLRNVQVGDTKVFNSYYYQKWQRITLLLPWAVLTGNTKQPQFGWSLAYIDIAPKWMKWVVLPNATLALCNLDYLLVTSKLDGPFTIRRKNRLMSRLPWDRAFTAVHILYWINIFCICF